MPKKGSKKPKNPEVGDKDKAPQSFVFRRGKVGQTVISLIRDVRRVMEPNTAINLQETHKNTLKDFQHVAPALGVTHFMIFSQTPVGTNLRVCRLPRGPTLSFRVEAYTLMKDIVNHQKKPHSPGVEFRYAPLVVLNNFSGDDAHKKIMATVFQNMFPAIDVATIRLADTRRVVLLHYDAESDTVEFRHYFVGASPVGLNRKVKRVIKAKIPNLNNLQDIADYVLDPDAGGGMTSDSEMEDTPETRVTLAQNFVGRGNRSSQKSAIRLKEMGPRMRLKLIKIEEEFCTGKVLYHQFVAKSEDEVAQLKLRKQQKEALKKSRKLTQEANVKRKQAEIEEKQQAKEANRKRKAERAAERARQYEEEEGDDEEEGGDEEEEEEEDAEPTKTKRKDMDDADWYRMEVGEEPEPQMFGKKDDDDVDEEEEDAQKRRRLDEEGKSALRRPKGATHKSKKEKAELKRKAEEHKQQQKAAAKAGNTADPKKPKTPYQPFASSKAPSTTPSRKSSGSMKKGSFTSRGKYGKERENEGRLPSGQAKRQNKLGKMGGGSRKGRK